MKTTKNLDLKNIKKAKTGGYQIQFIVNGKSHSGFSMDLLEAIKIRDRLKKELNVVANGAFKKRCLKNKKSLIPGTRHHMAAGITFTAFMSRGYETYYILVNWKDTEGKQKTKSFYCGKESTYTVKRAKNVYDKALAFRKAYEKAVLDNALEDFDSREFNTKKENRPKSNQKMSRLLQKKRHQSLRRKR